MKNSFFTNIVLILSLSIATGSFGYTSSEQATTIGILQKNIRISEERIQKATNKVEEAQKRVLSVDKWEAKNWTEVQKAMADYVSVCNRELATIDFNYAQLLKLDPSAFSGEILNYTPDFTSGIDSLKSANSYLRNKYDSTYSFENRLKKDTEQVKQEIKSRTHKEIYNTVGVPTDKKDHAENVLSGILGAFIRAAGTVYSMVKLPFGLYYYAKEMGYQVKSLKSNAECLAWIEKFRTKTSRAINLSDQGLQMFQKWQNDVDKIKQSAKKVEDNIKTYSSKGFQNKKSEEEQKLQKIISEKGYKITSGEVWPASKLKPLPPSSYKSEALTIIQAISSAVDSTVNGGDPYMIMDVIYNQTKKISDKFKKNAKHMLSAEKLLEKASRQYDKTMKMLWSSLKNSEAMLYQRKKNMTDDAFWAAMGRLYDNYNASVRSAIDAVKPFAEKVEKERQERDRLLSITYLVWNAVIPLANKVDIYIKYIDKSYGGLYILYNERFSNVKAKTLYAYREVNALINDYQRYSKNLIGWRYEQQFWRESELKSAYQSALDFAKELRGDEIKYPISIRKYNKLKTETRLKMQKYKQKLNSTLQENALAIISQNVARVMDFQVETAPSRWTPSYDRDQILNDLKKQIEDSFSMKEIDKQEQSVKLKKPDFTALAKKFEDVASKFAYWQDMISVYNARRGVAYYALQSIDYKHILSKLSNTSDYSSAVYTLLLKEMSINSWSGLNGKIDSICSKLKKSIKNSTSCSKMLPREKLKKIRFALYNKTSKILQNYISVRGHGGFAYASNKSELEKLKQLWSEVKPIFQQFDQIASKEHQEVAKFYNDKFNDIVKPTITTYNSMPSFTRGLVTVKQNTLMLSFNILDTYYDLKFNNTQPILSDTATKIDEWLTSYPIELKKYEKQREDANKEQERLAKERVKKAKGRLAKLKRKTDNMIKALKDNNSCSQQKSYRQMMDTNIYPNYNDLSSMLGASTSMDTNINEIEELLNRLCEDENIERVKAFYDNFKEAYESKDISSITAKLSPDWSSKSDGADIDSLEEYLGRSFRVFDDIQYNISNLNINPLGKNRYKVSYNVNIVGEIYDDDITHEERSSVQEEVDLVGGKFLITHTFGGRFWSVK